LFDKNKIKNKVFRMNPDTIFNLFFFGVPSVFFVFFLIMLIMEDK